MKTIVINKIFASCEVDKLFEAIIHSGDLRESRVGLEGIC